MIDAVIDRVPFKAGDCAVAIVSLHVKLAEKSLAAASFRFPSYD
jgi:hypothetical protein